MSVFYDPPYDSPLEENFALTFAKYTNPEISFSKQAEFNTICGRFIVDFIANIGDKTFGIECDGKEFHDPYRDEWRDAILLGAGNITTMYHLRGTDLTYRMEDCLYAISRLDSCMFSKQGANNLTLLASERIRSYDFERNRERCWYSYPDEDQDNPPILVFDRRSIDIPASQRRHWESLYSYAVGRGGGNLDEVIAEYKKANKIG